MLKGKKSAPALAKAETAGADTSGCPAMEGLMTKKNSHGVWKNRHGQLKNAWLMTTKPKNKKASSEAKESIDLREVESVEIRDDSLEITMNNGYTFSFRSEGQLELWLLRIEQRLEWCRRLSRNSSATGAGLGGGPVVRDSSFSGSIDGERSTAGASNASTASASSAAVAAARAGVGARAAGGAAESALLAESRIHISGYLQKKSHNKYHGFQERFVKLEGTKLRYFKKERDDKELGAASVVTMEFVRPFNTTPDCSIFEVQDQDRVFIFQCPGHKEMLRWIEAIERVKQAVEERQAEELKLKKASETPIRLRWFDEQGEEYFIKQIEDDMLDMYPPSNTRPDMTIKEHLDCAQEVVLYLQEFIPEIQRSEEQPHTRYDILAVMLTLVNRTLAARLNQVILPIPTAEGGEERHPLFENASLGDLHNLIDWITRYQVTLRGIKCPVSNTDAVTTTAVSKLSGSFKTPKTCGLFDLLPRICTLYVHGGSTGSKGGANAHLYDHCIKVFTSLISNPGEMLQRRKDGSFFTHTPIDMWEAINQHISLATSTSSPILHVMVAEKVVTALNDVFSYIINYVQTLDTSNKPELREIELEYVSALANDTALHIEEVIELIDTFTISEIREKIDDIFDPLTTNLVNCGQACLKRLAGLVMSDVSETLCEVFTPEWIEGNQVPVAMATISDYMNDFQEFLVDFWSDKFVYTILEDVILCYTRCILFPDFVGPNAKKGGGGSGGAAGGADGEGGGASMGASMNMSTMAGSSQSTADLLAAMHGGEDVEASAPKRGFFSDFIQKSKKIVSSSAAMMSGPARCTVDAETLGRLAQDVNTLNAFFSKKAGQEVATEFLALINEVSLMMFLDSQAVAQHVVSRAEEFPSAAQAVKETALAILRMRVSKPEIAGFLAAVQPALETAPRAALQKDREGVAEGRLSLLYSDLVPAEILKQSNAAAGLGSIDEAGGAAGGGIGLSKSLARKMINMSHISFGAKKSESGGGGGGKNKNDDDEEEEDNYNDDDAEGDRDDGDDAGGGGSGSGARSISASGGGAGEDGRDMSFGRGSVSGLVEDVMGVLSQQDQEDEAQILEEERRQQREEEQRRKVGVLTYDGYMEKKSPASKIWQRRFFKLQTRETFNPDKPYTYSFLWFKKSGGSVIKALEADKISSISVVHSPRALAYLPLKQTLVLQSEALNQPFAVTVRGKKDPSETEKDAAAVVADQFTFRVYQSDGKMHKLRGAKVDRVIKWINLLSLAAQLGYDEHEATWNRSALEAHKQRAEEYAAHTSFMGSTSQSSSTAATGKGQGQRRGKGGPSLEKSDIHGGHDTASGSSSSHDGAGSGTPSTVAAFDPSDAAALIKAAKLEAQQKEDATRAAAKAKRELEEAAAATEKLKEEEEERQRQEELQREHDDIKQLLDAEKAQQQQQRDSAGSGGSGGSGGGRGSSSVNPILAKQNKAREFTNPLHAATAAAGSRDSVDGRDTFSDPAEGVTGRTGQQQRSEYERDSAASFITAASFATVANGANGASADPVRDLVLQDARYAAGAGTGAGSGDHDGAEGEEGEGNDDEHPDSSNGSGGQGGGRGDHEDPSPVSSLTMSTFGANTTRTNTDNTARGGKGFGSSFDSADGDGEAGGSPGGKGGLKRSGSGSGRIKSRVSFSQDVKGGAGSTMEIGDDDKKSLIDKKSSKCCCVIS